MPDTFTRSVVLISGRFPAMRYMLSSYLARRLNGSQSPDHATASVSL